MEDKSYFDGGLLQKIGLGITNFFIVLLTLGICYPYALCREERWYAKHTVIDGKRLAFDGKAVQLIGTWIKWLLLFIITITIYGWWIPIKVKKWTVKHTHFVTDKAVKEEK